MLKFYRGDVYAQSVTDAERYAESIIGEEYYFERFLHDYDGYYGTYSLEELTFISKTTHDDKVVVYVPSPEQEQYYF